MKDGMMRMPRRAPGNVIRIYHERGFGAVIGTEGRIRPNTKPDPFACPFCNRECFEWPTLDMTDGTEAYHVPECAMESPA